MFARDAWHELPLTIEMRQVERLERAALAGGVRTTALLRVSGGGVEGVGEEVTFQPDDLLAPSGLEPWPFTGTLGEFSERLRSLDLFKCPPRYDAVRRYRTWAFEAAALDLALVQAGMTVGELLRLPPHPVRFIVSPPAGFTAWPAGVCLKIEASDLKPNLPVEIVDFKHRGDRRSVERALSLYPGALLEDPPFVPDGAPISWDTEIASAADVARLPKRPAAINVKPARVGNLADLLELYEFCARERIRVHGGGQHELGPGRRQIQHLAALFTPDEPNDVAPAAYNDADPPADLPSSPLRVDLRPGFG